MRLPSRGKKIDQPDRTIEHGDSYNNLLEVSINSASTNITHFLSKADTETHIMPIKASIKLQIRYLATHSQRNQFLNDRKR